MSKRRFSDRPSPNNPNDIKDEFEKKIYELRTIWRFVRDVLLFLGGLGGIIYETVGAHAVDQPLLVIFAGMMGLPAFLRVDEL